MPSPFPSLPSHARGHVERFSFDSPALKTNPWGDPSERDLHVYLPPGYSADVPLPVVFVLPAFAGTGEGLLARGLSDVSIATRIDHLIADGCPPFLAVFPDMMTSVVGSQYLDSPGIGAYGTYVARELVAEVKSRYATTGKVGALGRSSGGFGALTLAMDFPGVFSAVGSLAGDMGFDLCYLGDLSLAVSGVQRAGGLERFVEAFWTDRKPGHATFAAMNIIAMSCAYSPDPSAKPVPARFPVNMETGEVDFACLAEWRRFDPIVRAGTSDADALRDLDLLFLDAGDHDEYNLHLGCRRFTKALDAAGVSYMHEEFPGGHRGTSYRYDRAIPLIVNAML